MAVAIIRPNNNFPLAHKQPKRPDAKACIRVAPIKRKTERPIISSVVVAFMRKKKFSATAKPRAAVIIYTIRSTGSSKCRLRLMNTKTTRNLTISSIKALTPIEAMEYSAIPRTGAAIENSFSKPAAARAEIIPKTNVFVMAVFGSGFSLSSSRKKTSQVELKRKPKKTDIGKM